MSTAGASEAASGAAASVGEALVRPPSDAFARALSSRRATIDPVRARAQHAAYRAALAGLVRVVALPADEELPDACFVDDCAVVLGGQALLTRPGASSRAAEPERLAAALAGLVDQIHRMAAPATLDGGDVLRLGRTLVVGRSQRTNQAGVTQLTRFAEAAGGRVEVAAVPPGTLHLQSAVTALADDAVVGTAELLEQPALHGMQHKVVVPPREAAACNVVAVGATAVLPAGCPQTAAAVRALGFEVREVDLGEFHKADGGASCLSLLV
ncbi:MAG TPA: arginine deiminase family protein [Actinomycetes bacterium]|jgi:dimethylargininase|nr:arginine deiminase family protein [Actinomycetes bacterium]